MDESIIDSETQHRSMNAGDYIIVYNVIGPLPNILRRIADDAAQDGETPLSVSVSRLLDNTYGPEDPSANWQITLVSLARH